ncbi:hypothetical protein MGYG_03837 [Nannizzia gypsea CBS 118893]|uniref:Uncharacterized protein n=1 Tax=Arthroderma gypseum (strain ATCC MYA-4604 / CBS 118893) TaxID=535722 RepID=E4UU66_ARTGP|nr:hypothetical protein MGYG_03837 [Nannizzia gypsea CBS 118893]EFR00833.1 hypothetical protein MGYG_03837 [Nannizzia gypsea CBS 118893]
MIVYYLSLSAYNLRSTETVYRKPELLTIPAYYDFRRSSCKSRNAMIDIQGQITSAPPISMASRPRTPENPNPNFNPPTGPRLPMFDSSRDPRRASRNGPPDVQGTVDVITQLTAEISELTHINYARDRIIKKRHAEEQALKKARDRAFAYPSFIQGLRSAREDRDKELQSLDDRLNTHNAKKEKIILSLAHIIHSTSSQQIRPDYVAEDLQKTRDEMWRQHDKHKANNMTLFNRIDNIFLSLDNLRDDVDSISNTVKQINSNGPSNHKFQLNKDEIDRRFTDLSSSVETLKSTCESTNKDNDSTLHSLDQRVKNLMTSLAASKVARLNDARQAEERLQSSLKPISDRTDTLAKSVQRIEEIESKLSNFENTIDNTIEVTIPSLQSQVDKNSKAIQPQVERPPEVSSQVPSPLPLDKTRESFKEDLRLLSQRLSNIQRAHEGKLDTLSKTVEGAYQAASRAQSIDPQSIEQQFAQLNSRLTGNVNSLHGQLTATHAALHSLEHRYSQLVTEPIVRQMVLRMQEMYPYASRAQVEIDRLINIANDHIAHITSHGTRITALEQGQAQSKKTNESLIAFLRTEKAEITEKVDAVRAKIDELEESTLDTFANLTADVKYATEEIKGVKSQFQGISDDSPPSVQILSEIGVTSLSSASQSFFDHHRNKKRKLDEDIPDNS